ncbi:MAG TPA: VOC family protein [Solirubrobacteraceae bacterium]|jgi:catechol 2,3-dioxygenase-like lactoylglutathione lyase family enzyme|nr:VOC family protein [Solirubrobacteraceae bacterium]
MEVEHLFAGIPVRNRDEAVAWYEQLTGRAPDLVPNEREAAWRLTPTSWIYIVADPPRAGSALHTVLVDDLDGWVAALARRGIAPGAIEVIAPAVRQSLLTDPEGNRLKLGQVCR